MWDFIVYNLITMIIEKITALKSESFDREGVGSLFIGREAWIGYTFGGLFILIAIACFLFYPRAKRKAQEYRDEQLVEFNKQAKRQTKSYEQTGMYLPAFEKAKLFAPVFFGMVFAIVGIAWIVGNTLTTL